MNKQAVNKTKEQRDEYYKKMVEYARREKKVESANVEATDNQPIEK